MDVTVQPVTTSISGSITVPGDKSVSHRALLLGAIAEGTTTIHNFLASADCLCTAHCLTALGVSCSGLEGSAPATVQGRGLYGLKEPQDILYAGNSGTTARLLLGLLAGLPFTATLSGDASLRRRPMGRVTKPLAAMGAQFLGRRKNTMLPLTVRGGNLQGGVFRLPVASAQLKSALLLAGLYAQGETSIEEPAPSRDHTERMLRHFGVSLHQHGTRTTIPVKGGRRLTAQTVLVPGDISAAAFFLVAAAIIPGSCLTVQGVGLNPSRSGILDVLTAMGVQLEITNRYEESGEPRADISIESRPLKGTLIAGSLIPRLIDELPVLAVAACYAQGETVIKNAMELRIKESDRITALAQELSTLGADIHELPDGLVVRGRPLRGGVVNSHGDHRLAMALAVAALGAKGPVTITSAECVDISFPGFFSLLPGKITLGECR